VGAPPKSPFADVARELSTNVAVLVPTGYVRSTGNGGTVDAVVGGSAAGAAVVFAGVLAGAAAVLVDVDEVDVAAADGPASSSVPPNSAIPANTTAITAATTAEPMATAIRRRRRSMSRRAARGELMREHGSQAPRNRPRARARS
jgi:hypothetical protein